MADHVPAQVFSLAEVLADEMKARGWTSRDVAMRMSDKQSFGIRCLAFEMLLCCPSDVNLVVTDDDYAELARVFGVSDKFFRNVHGLWLEHPDKRATFECPDCLLSSAIPWPSPRDFRRH